MSIETFLTRTCKQVAVYWGAPVEDGYGGKVFANPREIYCRWEELRQVISDAKGNEITSRAVVYVLEDLEEEGMLFLGTLDTLYDSATDSSFGEIDDPAALDNVYTIKRFEKVPALGTTTAFLRKAYLTTSLSFGGL